MSSTLPKAIFGGNRSSFALIDPATQIYYRKLNRHGLVTSSIWQHVAISYVWSEWVDGASGPLPDWYAIRRRLFFILGEGTSRSLRAETGGATRCWLDSKCIDQSSVASISYWIPRMDEIYAEAKCTVLLLRDPSVAALVPVAQSMRCEIKSKTSSFQWQHSCLLSQSCMIFPEISISQEGECLIAMRKLYDGTWRKRAWIFQEILLSRKYIISLRNSEFIDLGDVGIIANFLFQRHPEETWLGTFADWCRRLWYLRHFYTQSKYHHLSDANVLQMATGLEATVPADKVYALCGILKLKDVPYNKQHSTQEAFQAVIDALVTKGRLSWLYAIPPSLEDHSFHLVEGNTTPFVLTRLSDRLVQNRNKMYKDETSIGFPVMCIGSIVRTQPLIDFLEETCRWLRVEEPPELPQELEYLYFAPKIIRRIALDVINPLLMDPLFDQLCHGLGINKDSTSRPTRAWKMILQLYTKDLLAEFPAIESERSPEDRSAAALVWSAARSIQERLKLLQHEFSVVWWQRDEPGKSLEPETISLGPRSCKVGSYICAMKDDEHFYVAASFASPSQSPDATTGENCVVDAQFQGAIYDLGTVRTYQFRVNIPIIPIRVGQLDMVEPIFGDNPIWDNFKDRRFDKYINTDELETRSFSSLFGKVLNQAGKPLYLKITYSTSYSMECGT